MILHPSFAEETQGERVPNQHQGRTKCQMPNSMFRNAKPRFWDSPIALRPWKLMAGIPICVNDTSFPGVDFHVPASSFSSAHANITRSNDIILTIPKHIEHLTKFNSEIGLPISEGGAQCDTPCQAVYITIRQRKSQGWREWDNHKYRSVYHCKYIPYNPCMVHLPTFGWFPWLM